MATGETDFQTEMINAVEANKGQAFKASNAILSGVPDLDIQLPGYVNLKVECKFYILEDTFEFKHIKPTLKQTEFLSTHIKVGGKGGIWIGYKIYSKRIQRTMWGCAMFYPFIETEHTPIHKFKGYKLERTNIENAHFGHINKMKGEVWPIVQMVRDTIEMCK